MGIKGFFSVFNKCSEIKLQNLKSKTIAIDAMLILYRCALGMKNVSGLTDKSGKPTLHINSIISNIIKFQTNGINQIWVFDHNGDSNDNFHNPQKMHELEKRRKIREKAQLALINLKQKSNENALFSSSDDEKIADVIKSQEQTRIDIHKNERMAFRVQPWMIDDVKYILNCFDIDWVEAPAGFEGEQICAQLTNREFKIKDRVMIADAVFSNDSDVLAFGAKAQIKLGSGKTKSKMFLYDLTDNLNEHKLTHDDMIKIGVILGCDFAPKTPRVGIKTVIKKMNNVILTTEQNKAVQLFKKVCDFNQLKWYGSSNPFKDQKKISQLLNWLVDAKSFKKERMQKQFEKIK
jgi:5'-3' exonuclease